MVFKYEYLERNNDLIKKNIETNRYYSIQNNDDLISDYTFDHIPSWFRSRVMLKI